MARRRPGRPKKRDARRHIICIRVDRQTKVRLAEVAEAKHMEPADVARTAIETYVNAAVEQYGYLPGEKEDK
jgi:predicted transcriptional regulator